MALLPFAANALPFHVGEKLTYSCKWSVFTAGHLVTQVNPPANNGTSLDYQFSAEAISSKAVSVFYPISYRIQSFWTSLQAASTRFEMHGHESDFTKDQIETMNYPLNQGSYYQKVRKSGENQKDEIKNTVTKLVGPSQDVLSVLYYVRTLNLPTDPKTEKKFNSVFEGNTWTSTLKYQGPDEITVQGKKYHAGIYAMSNLSSTGEKNDNTSVWISTDSSHLILHVESEVQVGKVKLNLIQIE